MNETIVRETITDAIGYWESRWIAHNAILLAVILEVFAPFGPSRAPPYQRSDCWVRFCWP